MTNEKAIEYNKNLREYMRITDKDSECKFLKENYEALDLANEALEQTRWIPVSERLPKIYEDVLITNGFDMHIGWMIYPTDKGWRVDFTESDCFINDIVAWMPLPEPYQKVRKRNGHSKIS